MNPPNPTSRQCLDEAFAFVADGSLAPARDAVQRGIAAAAATGEPADADMVAALQLFEALLEMTRGRYEPALARIREPLARVEAGPYAGALAYVYSCIGFALGKLGDPHSGLHWVARGAALARRRGGVVETIKVLSDEGCLHGLLQHHERSIARLTEAGTLAQKSAPRFAQAACLGNLAYTWLLFAHTLRAQGVDEKAGDAARRAVDWADRAYRASVSSGVKANAGWALTIRSRARLELDQVDEAEADLQQAQTLCAGYAQLRVELLRGLLALHRRRGRFDDARGALLEAMALCDGEGYEPVRIALLEDAVLLCIEAGSHTEALAWWVRHFDALQSQFKSRQRIQDAAPGTLVHAAADVRWPDPRRRHAAEAHAAAEWLDEVTGLLNMRGFEHVGQAAFESGLGLGVALLRIDGPVADAATTARVAAQVAAAWQSGFVAARGVGHNLLLLFPEARGDHALVLCEQLCGEVAADGGHPPLTVSIGLALQDQHRDLAALLADAVRALEQAMAAGGGRVRQASPVAGTAALSTEPAA